MFAEEWPLMTFTLLSQLAIGSFIMLVLMRAHFAHSQDSKAGKELTGFGFKAVGPLTVLALVFSLFHLGAPLGAYRSILNMGSSWLSREILTAGGFLVLWFFTYRAYKKDQAGNTLGLITSLLGLAAIFSMASIYTNSIRPAWSNVNTYVAFFGATFALGSLGAATLVSYGAKGKKLSEESVSLLKKVALVGGLAIVVPMIYLPVFISGLGSGGVAAQASAQIFSGSYAFPLILRAVFSLAGVALLYYGLIKQAEKNGLRMDLVTSAFVLVLVGEFIGRYIFYASAVSIMVGLK